MISVKDMVEVFKVCDIYGSGRIRIRDLQDLAQNYVGDESQVNITKTKGTTYKETKYLNYISITIFKRTKRIIN